MSDPGKNPIGPSSNVHFSEFSTQEDAPIGQVIRNFGERILGFSHEDNALTPLQERFAHQLHQGNARPGFRLITEQPRSRQPRSLQFDVGSRYLPLKVDTGFGRFATFQHQDLMPGGEWRYQLDASLLRLWVEEEIENLVEGWVTSETLARTAPPSFTAANSSSPDTRPSGPDTLRNIPTPARAPLAKRKEELRQAMLKAVQGNTSDLARLTHGTNVQKILARIRAKQDKTAQPNTAMTAVQARGTKAPLAHTLPSQHQTALSMQDLRMLADELPALSIDASSPDFSFENAAQQVMARARQAAKTQIRQSGPRTNQTHHAGSRAQSALQFAQRQTLQRARIFGDNPLEAQATESLARSLTPFQTPAVPLSENPLISTEAPGKPNLDLGHFHPLNRIQSFTSTEGKPAFTRPENALVSAPNTPERARTFSRYANTGHRAKPLTSVADPHKIHTLQSLGEIAQNTSPSRPGHRYLGQGSLRALEFSGEKQSQETPALWMHDGGRGVLLAGLDGDQAKTSSTWTTREEPEDAFQDTPSQLYTRHLEETIAALTGKTQDTQTYPSLIGANRISLPATQAGNASTSLRATNTLYDATLRGDFAEVVARSALAPLISDATHQTTNTTPKTLSLDAFETTSARTPLSRDAGLSRHDVSPPLVEKLNRAFQHMALSTQNPETSSREDHPLSTQTRQGNPSTRLPGSLSTWRDPKHEPGQTPLRGSIHLQDVHISSSYLPALTRSLEQLGAHAEKISRFSLSSKYQGSAIATFQHSETTTLVRSLEGLQRAAQNSTSSASSTTSVTPLLKRLQKLVQQGKATEQSASRAPNNFSVRLTDLASNLAEHIRDGYQNLQALTRTDGHQNPWNTTYGDLTPVQMREEDPSTQNHWTTRQEEEEPRELSLQRAIARAVSETRTRTIAELSQIAAPHAASSHRTTPGALSPQAGRTFRLFSPEKTMAVLAPQLESGGLLDPTSRKELSRALETLSTQPQTPRRVRTPFGTLSVTTQNGEVKVHTEELSSLAPSVTLSKALPVHATPAVVPTTQIQRLLETSTAGQTPALTQNLSLLRPLETPSRPQRPTETSRQLQATPQTLQALRHLSPESRFEVTLGGASRAEKAANVHLDPVSAKQVAERLQVPAADAAQTLLEGLSSTQNHSPRATLHQEASGDFIRVQAASARSGQVIQALQKAGFAVSEHLGSHNLRAEPTPTRTGQKLLQALASLGTSERSMATKALQRISPALTQSGQSPEQISRQIQTLPAASLQEIEVLENALQSASEARTIGALGKMGMNATTAGPLTRAELAQALPFLQRATQPSRTQALLQSMEAEGSVPSSLQTRIMRRAEQMLSNQGDRKDFDHISTRAPAENIQRQIFQNEGTETLTPLEQKAKIQNILRQDPALLREAIREEAQRAPQNLHRVSKTLGTEFILGALDLGSNDTAQTLQRMGLGTLGLTDASTGRFTPEGRAQLQKILQGEAWETTNLSRSQDIQTGTPTNQSTEKLDATLFAPEAKNQAEIKRQEQLLQRATALRETRFRALQTPDLARPKNTLRPTSLQGALLREMKEVRNTLHQMGAPLTRPVRSKWDRNNPEISGKTHSNDAAGVFLSRQDGQERTTRIVHANPASLTGELRSGSSLEPGTEKRPGRVGIWIPSGIERLVAEKTESILSQQGGFEGTHIAPTLFKGVAQRNRSGASTLTSPSAPSFSADKIETSAITQSVQQMAMGLRSLGWSDTSLSSQGTSDTPGTLLAVGAAASSLNAQPWMTSTPSLRSLDRLLYSLHQGEQGTKDTPASMQGKLPGVSIQQPGSSPYKGTPELPGDNGAGALVTPDAWKQPSSSRGYGSMGSAPRELFKPFSAPAPASKPYADASDGSNVAPRASMGSSPQENRAERMEAHTAERQADQPSRENIEDMALEVLAELKRRWSYELERRGTE